MTANNMEWSWKKWMSLFAVLETSSSPAGFMAIFKCVTYSWWKNVCSYKHLFLQIMAKIFFRRWHLLSPKPYWCHIEFACIWCSHNFTHPGQYLSLFQQCLFWGQLMFLFACLISFNPLILSVVPSSWCSWASSLNAEYAEEFYTGKLT